MDNIDSRATEFRTQLIIDHKDKVAPEILKEYEPEDLSITFNEDDSVLKPITVSLPEFTGDISTVENFGLPKAEQFFKKVDIPRKIKQLPLIVNEHHLKKDKKFKLKPKHIFEWIEDNQQEYLEEIQWIRRMWYHRIHGAWMMINGKLTYIDGWNWLYCNFWHLDIGLPSYRSRDRKFFLFARFCYNTTEAMYEYMVEFDDPEKKRKRTEFFASKEYATRFARKQKEKLGFEPEVHHGIFIVNFQSRTVYGFIYPKHRREGATYKAALINWDLNSRHAKTKGGMQAMDENTAKETWEKNLVQPWKDMWWFFKPEWRGTDSHKKSIEYATDSAGLGIGGESVASGSGLMSKLDHATTAHHSHYDGEKLLFFHDDETGKVESADVYKRNIVVNKCLSQGDGASIHGFTIKTSTVGEFAKGGGANFKRLCDGSMFEKRNKNGMTETGQILLFIPAYDGLEGFVDKYGNSVIDDPTPEQAEFIGRNIGAKEFLRNQIEFLEQNVAEGKPKAQGDLLEQMRLFPTDYKHLWIRSGDDSGFNVVKLNKAINDLAFEQYKFRYGNFVRDRVTNKVEFQETPDGRFVVSFLLSPEDSNQFRYDPNLETYVPIKWRERVASADPYKFQDVEGSRVSDGAGAVFMRRNNVIDGDNKPFKEWRTHRFICTYLNRPGSKDEYCEDMLAMTLFHGCYMSPEINVAEVWDYFRDNGFAGMLYHFYDSINRRFNKNPGFNSLTGSKQKIFDNWRDYIEHHVEKEKHDELLKECSAIGGMKEMTDFDLFTAGGGCLITDENMRLIPGTASGVQKKDNKGGFDMMDFM